LASKAAVDGIALSSVNLERRPHYGPPKRRQVFRAPPGAIRTKHFFYPDLCDMVAAVDRRNKDKYRPASVKKRAVDEF
jgi:hypothetical protein